MHGEATREALAKEKRAASSSYSPAQNTQNQVDDKERAEDDQGDKVDPGNLVANGVVHLCRHTQQEGSEGRG